LEKFFQLEAEGILDATSRCPARVAHWNPSAEKRNAIEKIVYWKRTERSEREQIARRGSRPNGTQ
jgi:hypothetical protein